MDKNTLIVTAAGIMMLLISSLVITPLVVTAQTSTPTAVPGGSSQIRFAVKTGRVQRLNILGTNQHGNAVEWRWSSPNSPAFPNIVQTDGWWWQGFVYLNFYVVDVGERSCAIDNLKTLANSSYTEVIYDLAADSCSGDTGSASTPQWVQAMLEYYLEERDAQAIVDAAQGGYASYDCLKAITVGLASKKNYFSVAWHCRGAATHVIQDVLRKYNKVVEFLEENATPSATPTTASAADTATPNLDATLDANVRATLTTIAKSPAQPPTPDLEATVEARVMATLSAVPAPTGGSEFQTREAQTQTPPTAFVGRWEQVSGLSMLGTVGTVWEFFDDGTVSLGSLAVKYSQPDDKHLKVEYTQGMGFIYELVLTDDQVTLTDSTSRSVAVLKRYKEFPLDRQSLAGTWKSSYSDDECFTGLGLEYPPDQISFGADGSVLIQDEASFFGTSRISLSGKYSASGNRLYILAQGTKSSTGILGSGAKEEEIGGEMDC